MLTREAFQAVVDALGPCQETPGAVREEVLAALKALAGAVELDEEERAASPEHYTVRPLLRGEAGWSVAAVILLPGQQTPPHDHESWGCAATVLGVERNRCFGGACPDRLFPLAEAEVPRGAGYVFQEGEIHQTVGAAPSGVTISLHFLVQGAHAGGQVCREDDQPGAP